MRARCASLLSTGATLNQNGAHAAYEPAERGGAGLSAERLIAEEITAEGLLCDSAVVADSKMYVQGGAWNVITTGVLPVRHPRIGIALVLRVPYALADNSQKRFILMLEDQDGDQVTIGDPAVGRIEGTFTVGRPVGIQPGDEQLVALAINLDGLQFEKAGAYVFKVRVDEREIKALRFRVHRR
jgi:hypothetical protein